LSYLFSANIILSMKTLVVYYSRSGHSKKVAEAISNAFKCDIEELKDTKKRSGILGWIFAGRDGSMKNLTKLNDVTKDIRVYDLIIIGGPIWAWNVCAPVRTFLTNYGDQIKSAAFFCTQAGSGAENAFKSMEEVLGKQPIAKQVVNDADMSSGMYKEMVSGFIDKIRSSK
jgi:flavodoxin